MALSKFVKSISVLLLICSAPHLPASTTMSPDFVVSPNGNDRGAGTSEQPFASLKRAVLAVRVLRRLDPARDTPVIVEVRDGIYRVTNPLILGPEDSGTEQSPVIYRAVEGASPVFSGGREIRGWREEDGGVWRVRIPLVAAGRWQFRELFIDGQRADRAQHPNHGFLRVQRVAPDRRTGLFFRPNEIPISVTADSDLELLFLHDWSVSRIPVASIDHSTRYLQTASPVGANLRLMAMNRFERHPRYRLENHPELLDRPGEWFLDQKTGVLRYIPRPGQNMRQVKVVAPAAASLLIVRGQGDQYVTDLTFEGLAFEHCGWKLPIGGFAAGQAAFYEKRDDEAEGTQLGEAAPAAVLFELTKRCHFISGRVEHVGGNGLWLGTRTHHCSVRYSTFRNISGNGIMIGEHRNRKVASGERWWREVPEQAASDHVVSDCLIEQVGRQFYGSVGIWAGLICRTTIEHNEIRRCHYTGISIG